MAADTTQLISAAMELRGAAPDVWNAFVKAMQEYSGEMTTQMLMSPVEALPRAQGMALQANEMARLLIDAPKHFDKMQAARMGKRHV